MSIFADDIRILAERVLGACRAEGLMLATAESCTGGLIAGALTEVAGSSDVVDRGFVTYSNAAKMDMLGVSADSLRTFGAVSEQVAQRDGGGRRDTFARFGDDCRNRRGRSGRRHAGKTGWHRSHCHSLRQCITPPKIGTG